MNLRVTFALLLFLMRSACSSQEDKKFGEDISTSSDQVVNGRALFEQNCSSYHNFNENAIGPNLSGLTRQIETDWIRKFIKNPSQLIATKDERTLRLLAVYKTEIPVFINFSDSDLDNILSCFHTFESLTIGIFGDITSNLIPEKIQDSELRVELEFFAQLPTSDTMPALAKMTKMEPIPGTRCMMINDQRIGIYELIDQKAQRYLDLKQLRPDMVSKPGWDTGPASFAFHPEFEKNGLFYTAHTESAGTQPSDFGYTGSLKVFMQWMLTESRMDDPNAKTFEGTDREIFRIANSCQAHGIQELTFNPNSKKGDP